MQLRDAAEALGVHYQTAYGWVRNGALPARKTPRGYQVSDADVHDLLARRAAGGEPPQEVQVRDWAAPASRLYAALAAGEETRARHDLGRLAAGVPLAALCDQVIAPALRRVGAEWAAGTLPIAVEHRATAICEGFIAARARPAPGRPRGVAVTATPPGERHALPALMAAACLRENHWQVHHLAADLPVTEVIALAAGTGASLIVLSSATTSAARAAAREAREIRERLPNAQVLAGHPGDTLSRLRQLARPSQDASGRSSTTERQDDDGLTPRVQQRHSRHRRTRPQCRVRSGRGASLPPGGVPQASRWRSWCRRGSTRPTRPPMRSISSSNSRRQRSRSTLRPAATARSSVRWSRVPASATRAVVRLDF